MRHTRANEIEICPSLDPIVTGAPLVIPEKYRHNFHGVSPNIPGVYKLEGFRFVDAEKGVMDATVNFAVANVTQQLGITAAHEWCDTIGRQGFRITFYGMCLAYSDEEYDYIKVVAASQMGSDCFGKKPGGCRLVQVSKTVPGTWTEYEGLAAAAGGGIEWEHGGGTVGMRIKYSLCPSTIVEEGVTMLVNATFEASAVNSKL